MSGKKWGELSSRSRRLVVFGAVAESVLKAIALADLARRPAEQVRGPKPAWAVFLTVFNSVGAGPVVYWLFGRRKTT
ncbi:MAG: PLDc_N domain-containing protein [Streptomycetaceae bacterium]|nr:PLDc_N domain-containing protein [Streptomycetaceae bacterium]